MMVNIKMNKLIHNIYLQFPHSNYYDDIEYKKLSKSLQTAESEILEIISQVIGEKHALKILDRYVDTYNKIIDYYEYKDFELYFFAGIDIGMSIKNNDNISYSKIIKLMESID